MGLVVDLCICDRPEAGIEAAPAVAPTTPTSPHIATTCPSRFHLVTNTLPLCLHTLLLRPSTRLPPCVGAMNPKFITTEEYEIYSKNQLYEQKVAAQADGANPAGESATGPVAESTVHSVAPG